MKQLNLPITQSQHLLLKTILGKEDEALSCYNEWIESVNFENYIDGESYALLPALYKRLESLNFSDVNINKYMGVYKKSFFKNSMLLYNLQSVGKELNQRKIPFTVLKGIPLIINYYTDTGIRSMNDIDLVVAKENIKETIEVLNNIGYKSDCNYDIYENLNIRHSFSFRNGNNSEIDLYWTPLPVTYADMDVDEVIEIRYKGVSCNMLACENFIIQVCIHGADWDPVFNIRWVPDVNKILSSGQNVDWNKIIDKIKNTRLLYTFYIMFNYFNDVSEIKIPDWVIHKLGELGGNRINYRHARNKIIKPKTVFGRFNWYGYSYQFKDKSILSRLLHYPKYKLMTSSYDTYKELAAAFMKKYILKK